jgi:nitrite reductase/ring-hydroxylating ferredoxin subunit
MPEKSWFFALKEKDLTDESIEFVRVKDTPIILFRKNGQIHSLYGKCGHMGCRLSKGTFIDEHILKCGCHGWEYDTRTGKHLGDKDATLETYESKVEGGEVLVLL